MAGKSVWYERRPARLRQEQDAMHERFPSFELVRGDDNALGWVGWLTSNLGNKYRVLIDYRENFPHEEPYAYILEPRFTSQHMWKDGHLCLMYPDDGVWNTNTTAATLLAIVAAWIFCYETHETHCRRKKGRPCRDPQCPNWPGQQI